MSLQEELDTLQFRQELHDVVFHSDIYNLPKPRRLSHLVLHHCKYVAELYNYISGEHFEELQKGEGPQKARIERLCVDGLIICLSMFNVANKKASDQAELLERMLDYKQASDLLIRFMGKMAKTIEDIDHMAQTNPLGEIVEAAAIMANAYINIWVSSNGFPALREMFGAVETRLIGVEQKNMFYERHRLEIDRRMALRAEKSIPARLRQP